MNIIGLGNALVDILLKLDSDKVLPEVGIQKGAMDMISEEQMIAIRKAQENLERSQTPGGSACNTMRALSCLGASTGFIGKIGTDEVGAYYEEAVRHAGVAPYFIQTEGVSGSCTVLISPDGERTMGTFLGPAATISADEIQEEYLQQYDCLYIEGYLIVNEPLMRGTMEKAKRLGLQIALDLSNFNIVNAFKGLLEDIIPKYVDILFCNESEAEAFTGLQAKEAALALAQIVDTAIVTIGKEGAIVAHGETLLRVDAEGGKPIDTTGAGDHFAAGFLYGQTVGASLEQSARIGSLLAGYVIDVIGPEIPAQYWEQIKLKVEDILV
ncbi:adenosine kinase [Parabacteroides sp. 52]|uniref:adenosine kinase n=1 Tax=unclassified Parabacteroides TaxID=2649774 RepID=UPI0013D6C0AA|nr:MULTISPECIES: adenosine kinase [unclassified Parabacteroides]MDH6535770.1 sugar/nucleoside kinase (ribokinase family) [Parabacteroides sp. PM5-20]NDV56426.1 adenosine kinase [Parabacteroides sp. 52]